MDALFFGIDALVGTAPPICLPFCLPFCPARVWEPKGDPHGVRTAPGIQNCGVLAQSLDFQPNSWLCSPMPGLVSPSGQPCRAGSGPAPPGSCLQSPGDPRRRACGSLSPRSRGRILRAGMCVRAEGVRAARGGEGQREPGRPCRAGCVCVGGEPAPHCCFPGCPRALVSMLRGAKPCRAVPCQQPLGRGSWCAQVFFLGSPQPGLGCWRLRLGSPPPPSPPRHPGT